jgi:hypothetical protein
LRRLTGCATVAGEEQKLPGGGRMRAVLGACAVAGALLTGGCALVDQELNNRGGYADHLADRFWMKADSKQLRVLRAYALQAAVGRVAATSPLTAKDRDIVAIRMARANQGFERAYGCAYLEFQPNGCVYFDDAIVEWTTAIFNLAVSGMSLEEGRNFVTRITSGGLDALEALFDLGRDAFTLGRTLGALYRDTVELEVVVWIDDSNLQALARTAELRRLYGNGGGDLRAWKAELTRLKEEGGVLPTPQPAHFLQISQMITRTCQAITSSPDAQAACRPKPLPSVLVAASRP